MVRQREPELKQTVEHLAKGDVGEALSGLEHRGRVHKVKGHHDNIAAIAKEYGKPPSASLADVAEENDVHSLPEVLRIGWRCKDGLSASRSNP